MEVHLKVLIEHPDPGQLEIRLTRTGSEVVLPLSSSEITAEGVGDYSKIQAFDETPASGEWIIRVRSTTAGAGGRVIAFWVAPFYMPVDELAATPDDNREKLDAAGLGFTPEATDYLYLEATCFILRAGRS